MCEILTGAVSQAGVSAVLGFLLSFVVEWFPRWETLAARVKRLVMLALCFGIGLGLWGIGIALDCIAGATIEGAWGALVAGFAALTASQATHSRKLETPSQKAERCAASKPQRDTDSLPYQV